MFEVEALLAHEAKRSRKTCSLEAVYDWYAKVGHRNEAFLVGPIRSYFNKL